MFTCITYMSSGCKTSKRCLLWYQPSLVAGSSGAWCIAFVMQNLVTDEGISDLDFAPSKNLWFLLAVMNASFVIFDLGTGLFFEHKAATADTEAMKNIKFFHFKTLAQCYTVIKLAIGILTVVFLVWSLSTEPEKPKMQEMHSYLPTCQEITITSKTVPQHVFEKNECLDVPECKIKAQIGDIMHVIPSKYYGISALVCDTDKKENVPWNKVYLNTEGRLEEGYWRGKMLQTMETLRKVKGPEYRENRQKFIRMICTFCVVYVTTAFGVLTLVWSLRPNNFEKVSPETEQQIQTNKSMASICAVISHVTILIYVYGHRKTLSTSLFIGVCGILLFIRAYDNSRFELAKKGENGSTHSTTDICIRTIAKMFTPTIVSIALFLFLFWEYDWADKSSNFLVETTESIKKETIATWINMLVTLITALVTLKGFANQAKK